MRNTKRGFIGLIGLLITAALIFYWVWKILPTATLNTSYPNSPLERSESGQFNVIDQAKETKAIMERK